ncbi:substrate-binding domain-containing protein [Labilibacter sediminis]|nr:substrate-binding domain-containing protein [Labilibacter sediminis]
MVKVKTRKYIIILVCLFLFSCERKKEVTIGFSYADKNSTQVLRAEVINEIAHQFNYNITLIEKDACGQKENQRKDLIDLYNDHIDLLLLYPADTTYFTDIVEKLFDNNIPVVLIDQKVNTEKYTTFIGRDNKTIGYKAGMAAADILNDKGSILTITGNNNSFTTTERSHGFSSAISKFAHINIEATIDGNWHKDSVEQKLNYLINTGHIPDLIFAHNDAMATWSSAICRKHKIKPLIIGVDGLLANQGGIYQVENGNIDITFRNKPGGDIAVESAIAILEENPPAKKQIIQSLFINKDNVSIIKNGLHLLKQSSTNLSKKNIELNSLGRKLNYQQYILLFLFIFSILILAFSTLLYKFLRQKSNYISIIEEKNDEISQYLKEEQLLSEELTAQNSALKLYKDELESQVQERTKKLEIALQKAEESDKLKSSFLSNFSHEVRTPLNSIIGFSNLLTKEESDNENIIQFVKYIKSGGIQLLKLINDFAEASIIGAEGVKVKPEYISAQKIIKDAYHLYNIENNELREQKSKTVKFIFNYKDNRIVNTDYYRIKQLLGYLIDNAIKFTHKGVVELGYHIVDHNKTICFYVKDTGIGIPADKLTTIFNKFVKLEDEIDVLYRGNGIGLFIAKSIAHYLQTYIHVNSELRKGSMFYFSLPYTDAPVPSSELQKVEATND